MICTQPKRVAHCAEAVAVLEDATLRPRVAASMCQTARQDKT